MKKEKLLLIAGIVWILAGIMVMKTGIGPFAEAIQEQPVLFGTAAFIVFFVFYWFIFRTLVRKHTRRVDQMPGQLAHFWQFFDRRSYIIMAVMMIGGMSLRLSGVLPLPFVGFFYTGLGFALFSCGTRFVSVYIRKNRRGHKG